MTGAGFDLGPRRHPRRMSLTPMIDVVFLLLIFFMLSSRFGLDTVLPVSGAAEGTGSDWRGAPRLIDVTPGGIALNGMPLEDAALAGALAPLMPAPDAPLVLRPHEGVDLQRLVGVMDLLRAQGLANLILVD